MILVLLTYCSISKKVAEANKPTIADDFTDGLTIISKSDCRTCHNETKRYIGPAWNDVAEKYRQAPDSIFQKLSNKIRIGGAGSWGEVPMAPHPGLSKANADSVMKYILSLKYN